MRVARHKSKVACFDFEVVYKPGEKNPADFYSRNPVEKDKYTDSETEDKGV